MTSVKLLDFKHIPWLLIILSILLGSGLKLFYSLSTVDHLRFILAPVSWGVEMLTGHSFTYEAGNGYISRDLALVINSSCAGINFWIILIMISLFILVLYRPAKVWQYWSISIALSFIISILINSLRISADIQLSNFIPQFQGWDGVSRHSLLSSFTYFFFMVLYYLVFEGVIKYLNKKTGVPV